MVPPTFNIFHLIQLQSYATLASIFTQWCRRCGQQTVTWWSAVKIKPVKPHWKSGRGSWRIFFFVSSWFTSFVVRTQPVGFDFLKAWATTRLCGMVVVPEHKTHPKSMSRWERSGKKRLWGCVNSRRPRGRRKYVNLMSLAFCRESLHDTNRCVHLWTSCNSN